MQCECANTESKRILELCLLVTTCTCKWLWRATANSIFYAYIENRVVTCMPNTAMRTHFFWWLTHALLLSYMYRYMHFMSQLVLAGLPVTTFLPLTLVSYLYRVRAYVDCCWGLLAAVKEWLARTENIQHIQTVENVYMLWKKHTHITHTATHHTLYGITTIWTSRLKDKP